MMAVNGHAKLHIDSVWVSYLHRGLYHVGPLIAPWDTSLLSVNNSDRLALSLGEVEVLLGCQSLEASFVQSIDPSAKIVIIGFSAT